MNENNIFNSDGFLADTDTIETLTKALTAGYGYENAPGTLAGGGALLTESLDATLKTVTWDYRHLRIWPIIPKDKAFSTVEQYNRQMSYGEQQDGGFFDAESAAIGSGTLPSGLSQDAQFHREFQKVRYMGTLRQVSQVLTLTRTAHGPAMALQIKAGTMWLLEQMERQLFEANGFYEDGTTGIFSGNPADFSVGTAPVTVKYNGLDEQIRYGDSDVTAKYTGWDGYNPTNTVIKDMSGNVPDEDDVTDWAYLQGANFGVPTHAFWPLKAVADVSRTMLPKERVTPPGQEGRGGFVMSEFLAQTGVFKMVGSRFIEPRRGPRSFAANGAPATPVCGGSALEADATSTVTAGTHYYRISALNQYGESLACAQVTVAGVAAGQRVALTINAGTVGAASYAVYESITNGSGWEFIGMVKDAAGIVGGGGATFRDKGYLKRGLGHAYLVQLEAENIVWRQLAPLMKLDLAVLGPAFRWLQMLYGTVIVSKPLQNAIMDNIGRA